MRADPEFDLMTGARVQRVDGSDLTRGKCTPSMRLPFLRSILPLVVVLTGCAPGKDIVDERALQARLDYQSTRPTATAAEFAPTPSTQTPEVSSFRLGPDDVVKISVLNDSDLETT